jgi:acyl-coenzyme A synthetase/AMP-(fatty) acid ligase
MIKIKEFEDFYSNLFSEHDPDKDYIISRISYPGTVELASGIRDSLSDYDQNMSVCLCTENKAYILAALLASIAGGPSVIMPHTYNGNVLNEIKDTTGFESVLTDIPDRLPPDLNMILLDRIKKNTEPLSAIREPDSLFLKIFTGGSTGKPKIWYKTPENIFSEALYHSNVFKASRDDIILSTVPPQHIYGLLFSVLLPYVAYAGAIDKVCAFPQEITSSVKEYRPTILIGSPMHYRALRGADLDPGGIRLALSSGGSLDRKDAEYFYRQTGLEILEVFGSTETGGIATRFNSGNDRPWKVLDNIAWKIMDGRLCVKSGFISPDLPKDKENFFITDDLVEKIDNHSFKHIGRSDSIVKIAGKRVDLKEIEDILKTISGVRDAVAVSERLEGGRGSGIAVIIEGEIDHAYVRQHVVRMLEPYAVPRKIRVTDKIPLLPTGKYDRQRIESILNL